MQRCTPGNDPADLRGKEDCGIRAGPREKIETGFTPTAQNISRSLPFLRAGISQTYREVGKRKEEEMKRNIHQAAVILILIFAG